MDSRQDQALFQIFREEKCITNFLDAVFGFLYRCTDFYVEFDPVRKTGLPPGVAENFVLHSFHKWKNISMLQNKPEPHKDLNENDNIGIVNQSTSTPIEVEADQQVPPVIEEVEVEASEDKEKLDPAHTQPSDSYNGAERKNYTWSQTISELDVFIKLPSIIKRAKDLKVDIEPQWIKVEARRCINKDDQNTYKLDDGEWLTIFEGKLLYVTKQDESVWSLTPGQHISIHLEKANRRWWEALIIGEPKIDLSKVDCSQPFDELSLAEQMKIEEVVWNHQQTLLGKPTTDQIRMENLFKKAADAQKSPLEGIPYEQSWAESISNNKS